MDRPTTARPAIITPMLLVNAQISEPTTKIAWVMTSMSFLPYRSPSRPNTGTATAPTSSVAVSSHSMDVADACRSTASCGSTGTSSDWVSETSRLATPTRARVAVALEPPASAVLPASAPASAVRAASPGATGIVAVNGSGSGGASATGGSSVRGNMLRETAG